jgi:hypothetical protein
LHDIVWHLCKMCLIFSKIVREYDKKFLRVMNSKNLRQASEKTKHGEFRHLQVLQHWDTVQRAFEALLSTAE